MNDATASKNLAILYDQAFNTFSRNGLLDYAKMFAALGLRLSEMRNDLRQLSLDAQHVNDGQISKATRRRLTTDIVATIRLSDRLPLKQIDILALTELLLDLEVACAALRPSAQIIAAYAKSNTKDANHD